MNGYRLHSFRATRVLLLAGCLLGLGAPTTHAQAAKAADSDAAILPYIDEGTFLVARLDVDKVDPDALGKYMETASDMMVKTFPIPADQQARVRAEMIKSVGTAKTWLADMTEAGGRRFYIVLDMADLMAQDSSGPTIVVPIPDGSDGQKVIDILSRDNGARMQAAVVGKAVVNGSPSAVARLTKRLEPGVAPVNSPDLARAIAAAGDAPLRIAFVPSESVRAKIEENLPKLPEPLGGGETKIVSRGIRYATIAVAQKPEMKAKLTLRAQDAASAKALFEVVTKGKAYAEQSASSMADADALAKEVKAIQAKLDGDAVSVNVDPLLLMSGMRFSRMESRPAPAPAPAAGQPAKKDDGGL